MSKQITMSVGIVTYESNPALLEKLLLSLSQALGLLSRQIPVNSTIHVICNDTESHHISNITAVLGRLKRQCCPLSTVRLIQGHGNIGYGAAQNLILEQLVSDFHIVLNPDVVLEPEALVECVRFMEEHPETAMLVPQGFDARNEYACLAKRDPTLLVLLLRALSVRASDSLCGRLVGEYTYNDRLPSQVPEQIKHGSGCFMFCRTSAFRRVGGFDDRYFLYFEDYDLSRRISAYGPVFELPTVKIYHYGGGTAHRDWNRIGHFLKSAWVFFNQYGWRIV